MADYDISFKYNSDNTISVVVKTAQQVKKYNDSTTANNPYRKNVKTIGGAPVREYELYLEDDAQGQTTTTFTMNSALVHNQHSHFLMFTVYDRTNGGKSKKRQSGIILGHDTTGGGGSSSKVRVEVEIL